MIPATKQMTDTDALFNLAFEILTDSLRDILSKAVWTLQTSRLCLHLDIELRIYDAYI